MSGAHFPVSNRYPFPSVAFDFDGTLTHQGDTEQIGAPREDVIALVERLYMGGWYVVIHGARPPSHHAQVTEWLEEIGVAYHQLTLGTKPAVDVFVDDKGLLPPLDALEEHLAMLRAGGGTYDVGAWARGDTGPLGREHRMTKENPEAAHARHGDDAFRVLLPVSGGVESTTLWLMARDAGLPRQPIYVDTGAVYAKHEEAAVRTLADTLEEPLITCRLENLDYQRWGYIDRGRNTIITWRVAQHARDMGWWGEIWLGANANFGEGPVRGGDKSHRWSATLQHLLTVNGHDLRLELPLSGMNKADEVAWCCAHGYASVIAATRSCHSVAVDGCGRCWSCYLRWLAFRANDEAGKLAWDATPDFTMQERTLRHQLAAYGAEAEYTSTRWAWTGVRGVEVPA